MITPRTRLFHLPLLLVSLVLSSAFGSDLEFDGENTVDLIICGVSASLPAEWVREIEEMIQDYSNLSKEELLQKVKESESFQQSFYISALVRKEDVKGAGLLFGEIQEQPVRNLLIETYLTTIKAGEGVQMLKFAASDAEREFWSRLIARTFVDFSKGEEFIEENLAGTHREMALLETFQKFVAKDVAAAAEYLPRLSVGRFKTAAHKMVGEKLFEEHGPVNALKWTKSISDPAGREKAVEAISWKWAWNEVNETAQYASETNDPQIRKALIKSVAMAFGSKNWAEGLVWVAGLKESEKSEAYKTLFKLWAHDSPEAAAKEYDKLKLNSDSVRATVASRWIRHDPVKAVEWIETWADSKSKDSHRRYATPGLIKRSPVDTARWIRKLPEGRCKDGLVQILKRLTEEQQLDQALGILEEK